LAEQPHVAQSASVCVVDAPPDAVDAFRAARAPWHGDGMADRIELLLQAKPDVEPLDERTVARIGRVARADAVELEDGVAVFGFSASAPDSAAVRGNVELAARFELGATGTPATSLAVHSAHGRRSSRAMKQSSDVEPAANAGGVLRSSHRAA
jgi:hypothetical protein